MASDINSLFSPKNLDYYRELTKDIECSIALTQDESAAVLKAYDRGVFIMQEEDELHLLNRVIAKLKDVIHP